MEFPRFKNVKLKFSELSDSLYYIEITVKFLTLKVRILSLNIRFLRGEKRDLMKNRILRLMALKSELK